MASTPEKKVKNEIKKLLDQCGAYYFSPVTGGFGSSGVPDLVACIQGRFIGIEAKSGKGKPTALQEKNLITIMQKGGISILVNENGIEDLKLLLRTGFPDAGILYDFLENKEK
jgi:Holliday junction resolvase